MRIDVRAFIPTLIDLHFCFTAKADLTHSQPAIILAIGALLPTLGQAVPVESPEEAGHELEARQSRTIACYPYRGATPYWAPIPGFLDFVKKIPNRNLVVANGPYGFETTLKTVDGTYPACVSVEYDCFLCGSGAGVATASAINEMIQSGYKSCVSNGANLVRWGVHGLSENTYFYDFSVTNDNFTVFATGKPCPGSPGVPGTLVKIK